MSGFAPLPGRSAGPLGGSLGSVPGRAPSVARRQAGAPSLCVATGGGEDLASEPTWRLLGIKAEKGMSAGRTLPAWVPGAGL